MILMRLPWVAMEEYGRAKEEWLKQFLELPNGIPSHDTISRVFARIDPKEFEQCFRDWVKSISELIPGEIISIDGKTVKHSGSNAKNQKPIHVVNAWATEQRLVLGQTKVKNKSNEITAIPEIIEVLELSGCLVTIDAMGTQTKIAQLIQDNGADYCLALKKNQPNLFQEVVNLFDQAEAIDWSKVEHDFYRTVNKGHGRTEIRRHWTMPVTELFFDEEKWAGLSSIGLISCFTNLSSIWQRQTLTLQRSWNFLVVSWFDPAQGKCHKIMDMNIKIIG